MHSRLHAPAGNDTPALHACQSDHDPFRAFSHPLWWIALGLLIVNDHLLKGADWVPSAVTGKLSDFAGMLVAPLILAALLRLRRRSALLACHVAVGAVFASINLVPAAAAAWSHAFASFGVPWRVWMDPSDLIALPALAVSFRFLVPAASRSPRPATPWMQRLALAIGCVACLASSPWPVAPPAVVGDRVLMEHQLGVMFIVDASSGAVLKTLRATGANTAPPAIHDRILYQVQRDGRITGIHIDNPQSPFTVWKHAEADSALRVLEVDAYRLYVVSSDDQLRAIERVFGKEVWSLSVETRYLDELTVVDDTMLVSAEQRVQAINTRTGRVLWTFDADDTVGPAAVMDATAYVASVDGVLHGLSLSNGREVWRYDATEDTCHGSRLLVQDGVVFGCFGDETRAISVESRTALWSHEHAPVAMEDGVLILRACSDTLIGVDSDDGQHLWKRELDDDMGTYPVAVGGVAYVRNDTGKLYAVDVGTGALRWVLDTSQGADVVAVGDGTVLVPGQPEP